MNMDRISVGNFWQSSKRARGLEGKRAKKLRSAKNNAIADIANGVISMKGQSIQEIVKQFPGEWVLIHILEMDEETTTPVLGELLAHSKKNEYIYEISSIYEETGNLLVEYSPAPEDNGLIVIV